MRLCTIRLGESEPTFGVEVRDRILRVPAAAEALGVHARLAVMVATLHDYLRALPKSEKVLRDMLKRIAADPSVVAGKAPDGLPYLVRRTDVAFCPPVLRPGKILCVGMNYRDHCIEQNKPVPDAPLIFNKFATSLIGAGAELRLPHHVDDHIDYEAELCVVIGATATRVKKRSAMKHVAGYTIMNDVSARQLQAREKQWARAKGFDGSGPCGPCIVTADEVPDPHALDISTRVNGKVRQRSNTKQLVFDIPYLIEYISAAITLEPGDLISTGTPGGVGVYSNPPQLLQHGDVVEVEIATLGKLRNVCAVS